MKRISLLLLCWLLAGATLLGAVGCTTQDPDNKNTEESTTTPEDDTVETEEDLLATLPQGNYLTESGSPTEFKILNNTSNYGLTIMDSDNMDTQINSTIYSRNRYIEEELGIAFNVTEMSYGEITSLMGTLAQGGSYEYDLVYNESRDQMVVVQKNAYYSVNDYKQYLDLEKPWWYADAINDITICGNNFLLASDMQMMFNDSIWCIAYNKDIINDHLGDQPTPYKLVEKGEWTMEKLYQMVMDTQIDGEERYGVGSWINFASAMLAASDIQLVVKDETSGLVATSVDDRFVTIYRNLLEKFFESNGKGQTNAIRTTYDSQSYLNGNFPEEIANFQGLFNAGKATFMAGTVGDMRTYLPSSEIKYGIIPLPKYEESQDEYISYVYEGAAYCGIPAAVKADDLQRVCTIMEWLGGHSYDSYRPVYYDVVLDGRVAKDPDAAKMLDIIFGATEDGKTYIELSNVLKISTSTTIQGCISDANSSIKSRINSTKELVDDQLSKIVIFYTGGQS